MVQNSMTALVSAFSRAYHSENNDVKIFDDSVARLLLSKQEYNQIEKSMVQGIQFFNPGFSGSDADALRWIVDNQLSPSPLGRSAFTEQALKKLLILERDNIWSLPQDTIVLLTGNLNGLPNSKYSNLIILL